MRISIVSNALVAVLVGFGGSVAIVLAGIQAVGASPAQSASWLTALCLAMAATSAGLSLWHRMPIVTAWSTPGAALIGATAVNGAPTIAVEAAVGAFLVAAALVLASAGIRPLGQAIAKIPGALASAMLAGILIGFSIDVFDAAGGDPLLVLPLVAVFLMVRVASATWAVIAVLVAGIAWSALLGRIGDVQGGFAFASLTLIEPVFDLGVILGLGVPLFLVSMASQNLPGFAVLRAAGYAPPSRSMLAATGLASLLTAPFGAHTTTMAAITAALCTGEDTHPDPTQRWKSGIFYGLFWLVLAGIGVGVVVVFAALPSAVLVTVAGLALIGPLMGALSAALGPRNTRFPATLTLVVTASSLSLFGIGAAFWGLVAGLIALACAQLPGLKRR